MWICIFRLNPARERWVWACSIFPREALRVCSFYYDGQCEGLNKRERVNSMALTLFLYKPILCHRRVACGDLTSMNPLQGSSFYDTINRLVVGIIATLWIFYVDSLRNSLHCFPYEIKILIYLIGCFIVGLFFSQLTEYIAGKNIDVLNLIFYKNKISWIQNIAVVNDVTFDKFPIIESYYDKYYVVQCIGLLGNVPPQEALSAFMLNLSALSLYYIPIALIFFCINCSCQSLWIVVIAVVLLPITVISRSRIEKNIYYSVIRASKNAS